MEFLVQLKIFKTILIVSSDIIFLIWHLCWLEALSNDYKEQGKLKTSFAEEPVPQNVHFLNGSFSKQCIL